MLACAGSMFHNREYAPGFRIMRIGQAGHTSDDWLLALVVQRRAEILAPLI
jgi:hypothetical protein